MATFHLRLKMISRSLGREPKPGGATRNSVVAAASYRAGEPLYDQSLGKWFRHENDVIHTEILAPDNIEVPEWVLDRSALWNAVEASEKRKDAALAREVEVMLPRELPIEQQIALVREFARSELVSRGMVVDIAIHCPIAADGAPHPHAHMLCTTRRLAPGTPSGFSALKETDWDELPDVKRMVGDARKRYNNTGLEEDREALEAVEAMRNVNVWRKAWQDHANAALADAGSEARIDHRTLEKQGIFRLPQINLGIARHIEKAYDHIKERVTQWVAIYKRAQIYKEAEYLGQRDPAQLGQMILMMQEMAERFTAQFKKPPNEPEVDYER